MTWVAWRQVRTQALVIFGGLALLAVATVVTGLQIRHVAEGCATVDCSQLVGCVATNTCLNGYTQRVPYQPWTRYWPFQWTETGLFVVLALLLMGFCFWWINGHRLPGGGTHVTRVAAPQLPDERTARGGHADQQVQGGSHRPRLTGVDR